MSDPSAPAAPHSTDEHRSAAPKSVRVSIVTISDTRTADNDQSGDYLRQQVLQAGHQIVESQIVPDDAVAIRTMLVRLMRVSEVVLTTGGTGITGRDVTVPVVESLLIKPISGFGELFRMLSYGQVRGAAMLSRATGGLSRGALLFAMPGSLNAVQTAWEQILSTELSHLVYEMVRHGQDHAVDPLHPAPVRPPAFDKPLTPEEEHEIWSRPFQPKSNQGASAGIGRHSSHSPVRNRDTD